MVCVGVLSALSLLLTLSVCLFLSFTLFPLFPSRVCVLLLRVSVWSVPLSLCRVGACSSVWVRLLGHVHPTSFVGTGSQHAQSSRSPPLRVLIALPAVGLFACS